MSDVAFWVVVGAPAHPNTQLVSNVAFPMMLWVGPYPNTRALEVAANSLLLPDIANFRSNVKALAMMLQLAPYSNT